MDYCSRYPEIAHLTKTTFKQVVDKVKNMFAHHGIPDFVVSNNGPQFSSAELCDFHRETTSLRFPQANGQAERGLQIITNILKQKDLILARMVYRATPTAPTGQSPCNCLLGREINIKLPTLESILMLQWPQKQQVQDADKKAKLSYIKYYEKHHGTRSLKPL